MEALRVTQALLRKWPLPVPAADSDKEGRGHVLVIAGSREVPGAAILAATAAMRVGAGKLTIAAPASVSTAIGLAMPESRVVALPETRTGALSLKAIDTLRSLRPEFESILCGPGMVAGGALGPVLAYVRERFTEAVVIGDAAALQTPRAFQGTAASTSGVLTPHAGEMAKLMDAEKSDIEARPIEFARRLASRLKVVVVLKGAVTIVADPKGRAWAYRAEVIGLATSGSGDVLAGTIAGLAARGATVTQACVWGIVVHAMAGRRLSRVYGRLGLLARELPQELPAILHGLAIR